MSAKRPTRSGKRASWLVGMMILFGAGGVCAQQVQHHGLVAPEVYQRASPAQKEALETCLRTQIPFCIHSNCTGTREQIDACMRPYGTCVYMRVRGCVTQNLGEAALRR